MNIANVITTSRIVLIPFLLYAALVHHKTAFLILFALGGLTDLLDGFIARKYNLQTAWGSALDTSADMLFYPSGILAAMFVPELLSHWKIIAGVIMLIGIAMITCFFREKMSTPHAWIAKTASASAFMFIIITLIFGYSPLLFWIVMTLTTLSAIDKFWRCVTT